MVDQHTITLNSNHVCDLSMAHCGARAVERENVNRSELECNDK